MTASEAAAAAESTACERVLLGGRVWGLAHEALTDLPRRLAVGVSRTLDALVAGGTAHLALADASACLGGAGGPRRKRLAGGDKLVAGAALGVAELATSALSVSEAGGPAGSRGGIAEWTGMGSGRAVCIGDALATAAERVTERRGGVGAGNC